MEGVVRNLVWSVYSFVNKENTKAEMKRILFNKRQCTKNEEEYINRLIINIGYYHILINNTMGLIENCLNNDVSITSNLLASLVDNINAQCSDDTYYSEVSNKYFKGSTRLKDHLNFGMEFVEKIEFDYVFYSFIVNLSQQFIKYFENEVNNHIREFLLNYNPKEIVAVILDELNKRSGEFVDFYSPPKLVFIR